MHVLYTYQEKQNHKLETQLCAAFTAIVEEGLFLDALVCVNARSDPKR